MLEEFSRTKLLLGETAMEKLEKANVAVFGIGGVGSFVAEALARSGIGNISLIDDDVVSLSNINRQLIATRKTIGMKKVEVMRDRILDINPNAKVTIYQTFYTAETASEIDLTKFNYIVDAIDTVSSKIILIQSAKSLNIPIISSMGAGNKLDPTRFEVGDIYETSICPLAKVMRYELRKRDIKSLKVVYSKEVALTPIKDEDEQETKPTSDVNRKGNPRRQTPGSISFVPSVAGLILAGEVIKDIIRE